MRGLALGLLLLISNAAAAKDTPELRVIVPSAAVRSGAGFAYRALYRAEQGELLKVIDRAPASYWFRVVLPDGRFGWIYGEEVVPFDVDVKLSPSSGKWKRFREAVFSPSPIPTAHISLSFSGGALGGDGMFMFRPSAILDSHFAIEGHLGDAVGANGSLLVYGVGGNVIIWPLGPIVPFVSLGGGGATSFPKVNGVTESSKTQFALDAGGGMAILFRKRITVRADVRNYTLLSAGSTENRQEYSGGLEIFF